MGGKQPRWLPVVTGALGLGLVSLAGPAFAQTNVASTGTPAPKPGGNADGWRSWVDEAAAKPAAPAAPPPTANLAPAKPRAAGKPRSRAGLPTSPSKSAPAEAAATPAPPAATPAPAPAPSPAVAAPATPPTAAASASPAPALAPAAPAPVIQVFVVLEPMNAATVAALTAGKTTGARPVVAHAPVLLAGPMPPGGLAAPVAEARTEAVPAPASAPAGPAPPPYSLPWQLRPATLANVARLDTALGTDREDDGKPTVTQVATLLVSRKLSPHLMPLLRLGAARTVPASGASSRVLINPLLGLVYGQSPRPGLHAAGFFALTPPFGTGGGDDATAAKKTALKNGGNTRSAMDGAMFAVNDLGLLLGGDLAYVRNGSTLQLEATLIQLHRMRGEKAQVDENRTNLTTGLHAGHFVLPQISLGAELRYQRWLSTPAAVAADPTGDSRDTVTVAAGARMHVKLASGWVRPGVSVSTALDAPLAKRKLTVLQVDLPVAF